MAVDRVEKRLKRVAAALEAAHIPYAVVGGNAVASWVARMDPSATRATKDVDLLVRRADQGELTKAMQGLGFERHDLRRLLVFVDPEEPSRRAGVQIVWADELVRPSYAHPAPSVDEVVRDSEGIRVLDLPALLRMKLTSFRDIDRVHVTDLLSVGLVDDTAQSQLSESLRQRLADLEQSIDD